MLTPLLNISPNFLFVNLFPFFFSFLASPIQSSSISEHSPLVYFPSAKQYNENLGCLIELPTTEHFGGLNEAPSEANGNADTFLAVCFELRSNLRG